MRWIDSPVQHLDAALAEARDRDGWIGELLPTDTAGSHALDKIAHAVHQLVERQSVGIVQRRRREASAAKRRAQHERLAAEVNQRRVKPMTIAQAHAEHKKRREHAVLAEELNKRPQP